MSMSKRVPILTVALAAAFIAATPAQSQVLQVSVTAAGATTFLASGGSLGLTSPGTGQAVFANVTVRYVGTTSATITGETLNGTSDMTLLQTVTPPITLSPNSSTTFTVQYLPGTGLTATAQVIIGYTEGSVASSFAFVLNGSSARLTFSYFLSPGGATTTLNAGDRIAFPSTTVGSSVTAVVSVVNSGATASSLQSVGLSGSSFQITGSPAPIQLGPGQQASFNVVFTPQTSGSLQGTLAVGFANSSVSFNLTGTGASPSFTVTYTLADGNVHALSDGSAISFPAVDINGTAAATIDIVNQGTGSGSVTGISVGGSGFRIVSLPAALPATVGVGQDLRFQIVFNPSQAGSFSGTFRISLSGSSVSGTLAGATATPNFTLAYVDPDTNNTIALQDGGAIAFPSTLVNAVSSITLVATNTGAGTGLINSITLGGSSPSVFQILNQPSLPASVPPTQQVRFGVRFSPQQAQTFSATMVLNLNGQTITINLTAQGTGAQFTYSWTNAAGTTTISPGGTIPIGNTSVGQTSSLTISVSNSGSGDGQVAALAVSGLGLTMANLPAVPFTLHPKGSQTFTLTFAPTQPGAINGTLTIGTDTFTIAATGVGARLIYTYTNAASTVSLVEGGVVILQPTAVESNASVSFSIQNTGTSDATISSINLAAVSAIFSLQQLPGLPMNLKPGDTVTFAVNFVPNAVGSLTAILNINNSSFTLSGTGTPPAALPSFQFQGPSGTQPAAQQPTVGLTLAAPYPLALQGSLTLTFTSAVFTDDPAIQFAAGGRKVNFTIPANSTQAVFTAGATSMPLQTGTTAGTILITPSFATQSGFDMTPPSPAALTLTIQRSAVQLSSASVTAETLTSFTVVLKGYSTTRTVTKLDIDISSKPGVSFSTSHLTLDVSSASSAWYQSNTSQAFGGAFLIAVPFVLSNGGSATDLVHMLQSLNITATNDVGTSSAASVAIP
jgi:hypothetical protein